MQIKTVRPARVDSYEHAFRRTGIARSLTDWRRRGGSELVSRPSQPLLQRATGVVYRPETERGSHYFGAVGAQQFDSWVWFERTSAVNPLGPNRPLAAREPCHLGRTEETTSDHQTHNRRSSP